MNGYPLGIAKRFDAFKKEHLYHSFRKDRRISVTLYDEIDDLPNAATLQEQILCQFTDDRGAYKRTHAGRFDAFDEAVLAIIKDRLPHRALVVHDIGASDARTSCEFFQKLLAVRSLVAFYASDCCPELRVIAHAGIKIVITPEGNLVEVVFPPFVFSASNRRERFGLTTRLLRFTALHVAAPIVLRIFNAGRIPEAKTINLFGLPAQRLARADARFRLLKYGNSLAVCSNFVGQRREFAGL